MLKKLENYGVNTTNLAWFASYLNGRKQYIKITESADTVKKDIKCEVPQGSMLGPILFLLHVNETWRMYHLFPLLQIQILLKKKIHSCF